MKKKTIRPFIIKKKKIRKCVIQCKSSTAAINFIERGMNCQIFLGIVQLSQEQNSRIQGLALLSGIFIIIYLDFRRREETK